MSKVKTLGIFVLIIGVIFIYRNWFSSGLLSGGDWVYYAKQSVKDAHVLSTWDDRYLGLGSSKVARLPLEFYFVITSKTSLFLGWNVYERIFWFFPFLLIGFIGQYLLFKKFFQNSFSALLSGFLFVTNTYALMLVGGGQMGIALAYAFSPFVLNGFISLLKKQNLLIALLFGLLLSALVMFDIRVAYMMVWLVCIFSLFSVRHIVSSKCSKLFLLLGISALVTCSMLSFWLLPMVFGGSSAISQFGDIYTSSKSIIFFSFAKLEYTMGLLHPNWPENLFGKVAFMRFEFMIPPIAAFSSLLFFPIKKVKEGVWENSNILFLAGIGLVGIFLAKGANDPFGFVYIWMFDHVPGFIMFRDPTKWYLFIVFSYSLLIPFTLEKIYLFLKEKYKNTNLGKLFIGGIILLLLVLLYPAFVGQVKGTLVTHAKPQEYDQFEHFLTNQPQFSRTLWVPDIQRFGFFSSIHPAMSANDFYHTASVSGVIDNLKTQGALERLQESGFGYVVVPYDSQGELFLKDRIYSQDVFDGAYLQIKSLQWISEIPGFGKLHVFQIPSSRDHFWLRNSNAKLHYSMSTPTSYVVSLENVHKGNLLVFSETFDKQWIAELQGKKIFPVKYNGLNEYKLPADGTYSLRIYYLSQEFFLKGAWISGITLFTIVVFMGGNLFKKAIDKQKSIK